MSVDEKSLNHDVEHGKAHHGQFQVATQDVYDEEDSGVDPVYLAKATILNDALQDIGMGRYQVSINLLVAGMTETEDFAVVVVCSNGIRMVLVSPSMPRAMPFYLSFRKG